MKAIALRQAGSVDNLIPIICDIPIIKEDEVLVKTKSISINPIDVKTRMGIGLYPKLSIQNPLILGWDISGIVVRAGKLVNQFKEGDEVFGMVNFPGHGMAYAEYVACPAGHLALKPENITHGQAAASCLAALTAWQALQRIVQVKKNDKILIHAAAGGVGHFAVQLAKHFGAQVFATCSRENIDFVYSLGADFVINYQSESFESIVSNIDIVLDSIGGEYIDRSILTLKKGGIYICLPTNKSSGIAEKSEKAKVKGYTMLVNSNGNDMKNIALLLKDRILTPFISKTFQFNELPKAHLQIESGKTKGKIVIEISN